MIILNILELHGIIKYIYISEKVEDMEKRLKEEILVELSQTNNSLFITDEDGLFSNVFKWVNTDPASIITVFNNNFSLKIFIQIYYLKKFK